MPRLAYGRQDVLHGVGFAAPAAGSLTALIGPNASGKSTLFRAVAGMIRPRSGCITLGGQDLAVLSARARTARVGFMPQSFTSNAALTVFDVVMLAAILLVAAGLRVWAPWDDVFGPSAAAGAGGSRVNFLETDAWYHVRLAESQVRNFPHRVTVDPYAAPNGQYVAVAPLLDTIIATAAFITQGSDASTAYIERVAALVPALAGVLACAAVWALASLLA